MLKAPPTQKYEPTWDIAQLFPLQGTWQEDDYFCLETNKLIEYSDGTIEILAMPSIYHQRISSIFYRLLLAFVVDRGLGEVFYAPTRVKVKNRRYREPDLLVILEGRGHTEHVQYWDGADLIVEIISPDDPERDTVRKRAEYENAGIPEYWLVDPRTNQITVLTLPENSDKYVEHGIFSQGETATSVLLEGFTVEVTAVFAVAK